MATTGKAVELPSDLLRILQHAKWRLQLVTLPGAVDERYNQMTMHR